MIKKIFDKLELKNLALASFVLGFIFSFRKWGYGETFLINVGVHNLIISIVSSGIVLLIYLINNTVNSKRITPPTKSLPIF